MFKSKNNLIFNGVDLANRFNHGSEFLIIKKVHGRSYIPTSRETTQVPNMVGGYNKKLRVHPRILEIDYYIKSSSYAELLKRIEEFNGIIFAEDEAVLQFRDEMDRTYYGAVQNISQTDEKLKIHEGKLTVVCADPFKYAAIPKTINGLVVHNNGTTETPFKLKMTATGPATYLSIEGDKGVLGIGKPISNRYLEELKLHDSLNTLVGWTPLFGIPDTPPNFVEVGEVYVISNGGYYGNGFMLRNVTTESEKPQGGRTVVKSVGTTKDFRVETVMELRKVPGENGIVRHMVVLVDSSGKELARLSLSTNSGVESNKVEVRIGSNEDHYNLISNAQDVFPFGESVSCKIILEKRGNIYKASVIRVDLLTGIEIREELVSFYTDALNKYFTTNMSSVAFSAGFGKYQYIATYDIKIFEYVDENILNPNVVQAGDLVEIDMDAQLLMINGQIRKEFKSIASDYFDLSKGKNQLYITPPIAEDIEISYRERYL